MVSKRKKKCEEKWQKRDGIEIFIGLSHDIDNRFAKTSNTNYSSHQSTLSDFT